jgi:O-antigen ligase
MYFHPLSPSIGNSIRVARQTKFRTTLAMPFWALVIFLFLTFFTGGGSRADIKSLIVLRPAAVAFCGIGLWRLKWEHVKAYRFLFGMAAAIFALVLSHLIPLPPSVWGALPGREIITEIDKVAELGEVWRPISMVPSATWNALYSLFVPLAVLLLGAQLTREERFKLLPWVLGLGLFSGFWGILQVVGAPDGPLYLYNVTNNGSAVGLFSNRNHQAIFLASLFPMLAVYSSSVRSSEKANFGLLLAIGAGIVLVPLLLITGSRAGLLLGLGGLLSAMLLFNKPGNPASRKSMKADSYVYYGLAAFGVLLVGALTIITSRAESVRRLFESGQTEQDRFLAWVPITKLAGKYFPVGSGAGSFVEIYQIDEPDELLSELFFNHAHNDWLELILTTGLPGLILLGLAVAVWAQTGIKSLRRPLKKSKEVSFKRLGSVTILIMALGSIGDYPLRAPSLVCIFVIAALWLAGDPDHSRKSGGSLEFSKLGDDDAV